MKRGLRLMLYDRTCSGPGPLPGLTASWKVGGWLYGSLGRLDARHGVSSWTEALDWLRHVRPDHPISEIQFWGHGRWGCALIHGEALSVAALEPGHPHHEALSAIRSRIVGPEALWWFRTCETFGAEEGQQFAREWTTFFGCRAAGHTFVIGPLQSGLHSLRPAEEPTWSPTEGLSFDERGARREMALWSSWRAPNTITCFQGRVPEGY